MMKNKYISYLCNLIFMHLLICCCFIPCNGAMQQEGMRTKLSKPTVRSESFYKRNVSAERALQNARQVLLVSGVDDGARALENVGISFAGTLTSIKAYSMLANIYSTSSDWKNERQAWVEAVASNGRSIFGEDVARGLGSTYIVSKEYKPGIVKLRALIKQYPKTQFATGATLMIGRLFDAHGDLNSAIAAYYQTCRISPNSESATDAVDSIRTSLLRVGDQNRALTILQDLEQRYYTKEVGTAAEYSIGLIYINQKRFDLAESSFRSILDRTPQCSSASAAKASLLQLYWDQSNSFADPNIAINFYEKVLKYEYRGNMIGEANCMICIFLMTKGSYQDVHNRVRLAMEHPLSSEFGLWAGEMRNLDAMSYYNTKDYVHALPALRGIVSTATDEESKKHYGRLIEGIEKDMANNK